MKYKYSDVLEAENFHLLMNRIQRNTETILLLIKADYKYSIQVYLVRLASHCICFLWAPSQKN